MIKFLYSFLLFLFISNFSFSQTIESIEEKLQEALELSSTDASAAISLYNQILKDSKKIKFEKGILDSSEALSIVYFNNGEYEKVISISDDVEKLALRLGDFGKLAGLFRNVGASYSIQGLNDQALKSLDKAKLYAGKIKDSSIRHYTTALIYDSYSACLGDANEDINQTILYINKSLEELAKISDEEETYIVEAKYDLIGFQYLRLADLYFLNLKNNAEADKYYMKALEIYDNPDYNVLPNNKGRLYASLSDYYFSQNNFEKSITYGEETLKMADVFVHPPMRKEAYRILFKAYLEIGEKKKSKHYADLYTKLNDSIQKIEKSGANASLEKIITEKDILHKETMKIILIASSLIVFLLIVYLVLWKMKYNRIRKKYELLIEKIKKEKNKSETHLINSQNNKEKTSFNITDETAKNLLFNLEKFENTNKYLRKEVSLTWLANQLNTNTKYLSEIIKTHKNKTFSNYINGLRIDYIVHKLVEEPLYREYKINYLAEECGYSSRQVFVIAFKKETGFTPSYFIENLKKEKFE